MATQGDGPHFFPHVTTITTTDIAGNPRVFSRFPNLPIELRLIIWELAIRHPRVICMDPDLPSRATHLKPFFTIDGDLYRQVPVLYFVNEEARAIASKKYINHICLSIGTHSVYYLIAEDDIVHFPLDFRSRIDCRISGDMTGIHNFLIYEHHFHLHQALRDTVLPARTISLLAVLLLKHTVMEVYTALMSFPKRYVTPPWTVYSIISARADSELIDSSLSTDYETLARHIQLPNPEVFLREKGENDEYGAAVELRSFYGNYQIPNTIVYLQETCHGSTHTNQ
ncbi:hypothetical protein F5X99DRAFT_404802 [Biscogniauxia marginata]|nr:hypothetical protein F5X99DRAFT_404802 [Biscogniauxia marginata]